MIPRVALIILGFFALVVSFHAAKAQGLLGIFQRPASAVGCTNSLNFSQTCNSMYVAFPGV